MANAVFCVAFNIEHTTLVVDHLRADGFDDKQISLVAASDIGAPPPPRRSGSRWASFSPTPELPVAGAAADTLGLLAGLTLLAVPAVGRFLAAGPLVALLNEPTTDEGLVGALTAMGLVEPVAKTAEGKISAGNVLVVAHCDNTAIEKKAKASFYAAGATDVTAGIEAPAAPRGGAGADHQRPVAEPGEPPLLDFHERP